MHSPRPLDEVSMPALHPTFSPEQDRRHDDDVRGINILESTVNRHGYAAGKLERAAFRPDDFQGEGASGRGLLKQRRSVDDIEYAGKRRGDALPYCDQTDVKPTTRHGSETSPGLLPHDSRIHHGPVPPPPPPPTNRPILERTALQSGSCLCELSAHTGPCSRSFNRRHEMKHVHPHAVDSAKLDALVARAFADLSAGYGGVMISVGNRLGLYKAMAGAGPLSPRELAARAGCAERYVREWLNSQVAGGYIDYHPLSDTYELTPEQAM